MKSTKQLQQKLIKECKRQKPKAQLQLYNMYCKAMLQIAYRYVKDISLAEDVMQDAFIKAFKKIDSYTGKVAFGAWLKKIVINQSIDELKRKKLLTISINEEVLNVVEDTNWKVENEVAKGLILKAIAEQKEKYRFVLNLYLIEGFDHNEIAEILGITVTTSRTHLMRGKKLVKEYLNTKNYAEGY